MSGSRVVDLGPSESPHDSIWLLGDDRRDIFLDDQIYCNKHAYLADGFHREWLANIAVLERELPADATLHVGHGGPVTAKDFQWQREYIETFLDAVQHADWSQPDAAKGAVVERMTRFLPTDELRFLIELSIEPVAIQLGLTFG